MTKNSYKILTENGKLIITFRDMTFELKDEERFIPVNSDNDRIFTCFLEYHPDYVKVFDIVLERKNGKWTQKISSYKKLKISQKVIEKYFQDSGFKIEFMGVENGLVTVIGKKQS